MEKEESFLRSNEELMREAEAGLPDDLIEELDRALEDITIDTAPKGNGGEENLVPISDDGLSLDPGIRDMQETFLAMVRNTLSPVARYMKAVMLGENDRELLEISEYITAALVPKVEEVGLDEHAEDLSFFRSLLLLALGERERNSSRAMTEVVMEGFSKLTDRFNLSYRGYRLAVRNLVEFYRSLRSTDGVSESDMRKFFAIGVPSLTWVRRTRVSEMVSLSGISPEAMGQIRKLAYAYRSVPPTSGSRLAREDILAPTPRRPKMLPVSIQDFAVEEVAVVEGIRNIRPPVVGEA